MIQHAVAGFTSMTRPGSCGSPRSASEAFVKFHLRLQALLRFMKSKSLVFYVLSILSWMAVPADAQVIAPCVTINCPTNIVVPCAPPAGAVVDFTVTGNTTCGRVLTITCEPASGSLFRPGTNIVACVARDSLGNYANCSFKVTVIPDLPPVLYVPESISVPCTNQSGAVVTFEARATDSCSTAPVQITCTPPSGSWFRPGTTPVTCVAQDATGQSTTNSFPVQVTGACDSDCLTMVCPRD